MALTSWKIPMNALATSTSPKVASWIGPTTRITASIAPRMALNRVNTLARTISLIVRLVRVPASLVTPRATRSWTSTAVNPAAAVLPATASAWRARVTRSDAKSGPGQESTRTRAISPVASSSSTR